MTLFIKSLFTLILVAFVGSANAVKVTVHNQAHYFVSFEVNGRHSGNFGIGQSRTMEDASGIIRINWLPGFHWCSRTEIINTSDFVVGLIERTAELQVGRKDVEIIFQGDVINPVLWLNGFNPVPPVRNGPVGIPLAPGFEINGFYTQNEQYIPPRCEWRNRR